MSIKNQKTLLISAFAIIALTVVGLALLNFAVEKISQIKPKTFALLDSPSATDDIVKGEKALERAKKDHHDPSTKATFPGTNDMFQRPGLMHGKPPMYPPEGLKRLRNGKDGADFKRQRPPMRPPGGSDDSFGRGANPSRPPEPMDRNMMMPPMPDGMRLSPAEREQMEREMERRRELFNPPEGFPQGFPPGYYPPPPGYEGYDGPPPGFDGDYNDYDYDYNPELEGMRREHKSEGKKEVKLSDVMEDFPEDDLEDPDYGLEDEYLADEYQ